MAHIDTSDKHFQFRCCWTCQHCILDISQGYLCDAPKSFTIPLAVPGESINETIHKDRRGCKAYLRDGSHRPMQAALQEGLTREDIAAVHSAAGQTKITSR